MPIDNVVIQKQQLLFERACDDATVLVAVNAVGEPYTFGAGELNGSFVGLLGRRLLPRSQLTGTLELAPLRGALSVESLAHGRV